jgi:integrase
MPSIRARPDNGLLFFDFRFKGQRCRELTLLEDTPANQKKLQKVMDRIETEIRAGTFVYANYFPNSKALHRFAKEEALDTTASAKPSTVTGEAETATTGQSTQAVAGPVAAPDTSPLFRDFANQWVDERSVEWRRSHVRSLLSTLNGRILPFFGARTVRSITKADVLTFRAEMAKLPGRGNKPGLSAKRINEIIGVLNQILDEAAERFEYSSPAKGIRRLKVRKTDVHPFSLAEVQNILNTVRVDFRNYFFVRFFTGMRTGEVHGLKWKYVRFDLRMILVRETFVLGEDEYTKTEGSQRDIQMSQPVFEALQEQYKATGAVSEYVFCNLVGSPLDNKNFTERVWYPLLRHLDLEPRKPYQMRHTAATLWLASGEAPEWIARQLGHTSTEMLFRVYSRYVPNLTRMDGSAMDRLLASRFAGGSLVPLPQSSGTEVYVPAAAQTPTPMPVPRRSHRRKPATQAPAAPAGRDQFWQGKPFTWPRPEGDDAPQPPPALMALWQTGISRTSATPLHC